MYRVKYILIFDWKPIEKFEFLNDGFGIEEAIELTIEMSSLELSPRNKTSIRKRMLDSYYTFQKIIGEQVQMKMHLDSDIRTFLI